MKAFSKKEIKTSYNIYVVTNNGDNSLCEELNLFLTKISDSTIYYREENDSLDYSIFLRNINLVVYLLDDNLLKDKNILKEKNIIDDYKIPILPLTTSTIDSKLFNELFGDLHFINLFNQQGEINKEDIKLFIDSILVDQNTIERIKQSFDAYVFLSYRKKDRKYALDLISSLQSNPHFLNIGIWFDDYLTPGQDFNSEIENYLDKSFLFSLIVTPNLINEDNYVQEIEYPKALNKGKKIVPFEYVKTDRQKLTELFPKLPEINSHKNDVIQNVINDALTTISLKEDYSPEHLYFLGLAYLYGIDTIKNINKAISLLSQSSNSNFYLASKKLSDIYYFGMGVDVDLANYQTYLKKYVIQSTETNLERNNLEEVISLFISCSDYRKEIAQIYSQRRNDLMSEIMLYLADDNKISKENIGKKALKEAKLLHEKILKEGKPKEKYKKVLYDSFNTFYYYHEHDQRLENIDDRFDYLINHAGNFKKEKSLYLNSLQKVVEALKEQNDKQRLITLYETFISSNKNNEDDDIKNIANIFLAELETLKKGGSSYEHIIKEAANAIRNFDSVKFGYYIEKIEEKMQDDFFADQASLFNREIIERLEIVTNEYYEIVKAIEDVSEKVNTETQYLYLHYVDNYFRFKQIGASLKQDLKLTAKYIDEQLALYMKLIDKYKKAGMEPIYLYQLSAVILNTKAKLDLGVNNSPEEAINDYKRAVELLTCYEGGYAQNLASIFDHYIRWLNVEYSEEVRTEASKAFNNLLACDYPFEPDKITELKKFLKI